MPTPHPLRPAFGLSVHPSDYLHHDRLTPLITCTPGVRSGKACVAGTRITVTDVLEYLASGMSQEEILTDFPDLQPEHIQAVLFAARDTNGPSSDKR
jgi:uncharacterized protein (DUF433 family)